MRSTSNAIDRRSVHCSYVKSSDDLYLPVSVLIILHVSLPVVIAIAGAHTQ